MTDTFELYDVVLVRHLDQFKTMFPYDKPLPNPACSIIKDANARAMWTTIFGCNTEYVSYADFENRLLRSIPGVNQHAKPRTWKALKFLVNFPRDDLMTPYKWNVLIRLFGPIDSFFENFNDIVLGPGFLGLLNQARADNTITRFGDYSYLIRFSRGAPGNFTVTYKTPDMIYHKRSINENGDPIPLKTFLATDKNLKAYYLTPVPMLLDIENVDRNSTLRGQYQSAIRLLV
jgi:hypothetical protein